MLVDFSKVLILAILVAGANTVYARELLMFESDDCPWCEQWHDEVGVIYKRTEEGQRLPLRKIDFYSAVPDDLNLSEPVRFTPTFVVIENGREVGRINGYPGEANFWGLLAVLLKKLENEAR